MTGGPPVQPPGYAPYYPPATPARLAVLPKRRPPAPELARGGQSEPAVQGRFRLKGAEELAPRPSLPPLEMPSPESLGRSAEMPVTAEVDWSAVRQRLDGLKASSFHLQKSAGGFRFSCVINAAAGERRRIEAEGATEASAIDAALRNAERAE